MTLFTATETGELENIIRMRRTAGTRSFSLRQVQCANTNTFELKSSPTSQPMLQRDNENVAVHLYNPIEGELPL